MNHTRTLLLTIMLALLSTPAAAQDAVDAEPIDLSEHASLSFGTKGQWYWGVAGGAAFGEGDQHYTTRFNLHHFLADGLEVNFTFAGWYFDQEALPNGEGDDTFGGSFSFGFRWHFVSRETWSLYLDTGIGVMGSGEEVPAGGTEFNFLPRAGVGGTVQLFDSNMRLDAGLAWHHVSNASISGSDDNPAFDGVMIYAGIMVPF